MLELRLEPDLAPKPVLVAEAGCARMHTHTRPFRTQATSLYFSYSSPLAGWGNLGIPASPAMQHRLGRRLPRTNERRGHLCSSLWVCMGEGLCPQEATGQRKQLSDPGPPSQQSIHPRHRGL